MAGRDPERAAVDRLLDAASARLAALVLEGEAGIGKTTVWRDAVGQVRAAAHADAQVGAVWEQIGTERLNGARLIVGHLEERGGLRSGLDLAGTADLIWVLNDPGFYHMLVHRRGWSTGAYERQLTDVLVRQLL
ncbi:MAG: hypothetical protein H0U86_12675 [Chloroflexi bacterium]|nr:hypothetical protein [Chloroflexota bacterium]